MYARVTFQLVPTNCSDLKRMGPILVTVEPNTLKILPIFQGHDIHELKNITLLMSPIVQGHLQGHPRSNY